MVNGDLPLTEQEISELEKELTEKKLLSKERLTEKEIEQAKKEFLRKKKKKDSEEEKIKISFLDSQNSKSLFFKDKNKFIESFSQALQNMERTNSQIRSDIARNLEQQVSWIKPSSSITQNNNPRENEIKYSNTNYDETDKKKYNINEDVEHHLVKQPQNPQNININNVGRTNPSRQALEKEVEFSGDYPSQKIKNNEDTYIKPEKKGFENEKENSFFEKDPRERNKKYEIK